MMKFKDYMNITNIKTSSELITIFKNMGYKVDIARSNSNKVILLVPAKEDRIKLLNKLAYDFNGYYDDSSTALNISSQGVIRLSNNSNKKLYFYAKPEGKAGKGASGINNEMVFVNTLKNLIKENGNNAISIEFIDERKKTFRIDNIIDCKAVGTAAKSKDPDDVETSQSIPKKADVIIITKTKKIPISLKQHNAEKWESCEAFAVPILKNTILDAIMNNSDITLLRHQNYSNSTKKYKLKNTINIKCNPEEAERFVFGSDILNHGAVIKKTFINNIFVLRDDNVYVCKVDKIIRNMNDLGDKDYPCYYIRNDVSRNSLGVQGLRIEAVVTSSIPKNSKNIKRSNKLVNMKKFNEFLIMI